MTTTPRFHRHALAAAAAALALSITPLTAGAQDANKATRTDAPTATSPTSPAATMPAERVLPAARPADHAKMGDKAGADQRVDRSDRKFVEKAAAGGIAEVEMGKLAQQNAADDRVKQFGERMVQDHGKANDELKELASKKGIEIAAAPDKSAHKDMEKLGKLKGPDFDRAYMKHMVSDHKKDVASFEKAAKSAKDEDVKAFAAKTLPTLKEHLKLAQSTHDAIEKGRQHAAAK